jgi:L-amino acid N-acyltransferase YncA
MRVRLATVDDAEETLDIYNHEVLGGTATFDLVPRTLAEQRQWIADHAGVHPAVVAVDDGDRIRGFASVSPYRPRAAYLTTVEDSVYVHPEARGEGVGRAVLSEVVALAASHGFHTVVARINAEGEASIALHHACGFNMVGTERQVGRKFNRWLDVVVMQRML